MQHRDERMRLNDTKNFLMLESRMTGCPVYYRDEDAELVVSGMESGNSPFVSDRKLLDRLTGQRSGKPYLITDEEYPEIYYGIFQDKGILYAIGPAAGNRLPLRHLSRYIHEHGIEDARNYHIPVLAESRMRAMLALIFWLRTTEKISPEEIELIDAGKMDSRKETASVPYLEKRRIADLDEEKPHYPLRMEQTILDHIRHGDPGDVDQYFFFPDDYTSGKLAFSEYKDLEYKVVGALSLYCRAAIDGGVNPYDSYAITEIYMQKAALSETEEELRQCREECFLHLCRAVREAKFQMEGNVHVEKCKHFLDGHVHKAFSYVELAEYVGVSPNYLSRLFKKTEGRTISEYLMDSRLEAAENMLKFSEYPVSRISDYFCFCDQSHFTKCFKKKTGLSPAEYRKRNKDTAF